MSAQEKLLADVRRMYARYLDISEAEGAFARWMLLSNVEGEVDRAIVTAALDEVDALRIKPQGLPC